MPGPGDLPAQQPAPIIGRDAGLARLRALVDPGPAEARRSQLRRRRRTEPAADTGSDAGIKFDDQLVDGGETADLGSNEVLPIGSDVVQSRVVLGIGELEAEPGDHICGVFSGEAERDQVLIPFLQAGLASGDKCICIVDGTAPGKIVAALGPVGQAAALTGDKQLEVIAASDMYLRSPRFSADEVIGAWKAAISDAMYAGRFDVVRAAEAWSRRDLLPDMNELLMLESEMNRYLPLYPQVMVCMYDIDQFGGGALMNLVMTHPRMLMRGMLIENPYYLTPDEVLAKTLQRDAATGTPITKEAQEWYSDVMTG